MEARKITIISTRNNKRTVINTDATTLGELKSALREADIDYNNMTFYEGLTKTELKLDESILPHDVRRINPVTREPETTNELAFMLTNTNKKIKSGTMTRTEAYAAIKKNGLVDVCKRQFGKNFTMCKTADLISLIENSIASAISKPAITKKEAAPKETIESVAPDTTPSMSTEPVAFVDVQARAAIKKIANALYQANVFEYYKVEEILNILDKDSTSELKQDEGYDSSSDSPYSDDELDDMFKDMSL